MYGNKKIAVIIAAAGSGTRMGSCIPKQYMELQGKPILTRTVEAFSRNALIDEIFIVTNRDYIGLCDYELKGKRGLHKIRGILEGGAQRQDSVSLALNVLPSDIDYVLVHDGARPFILDETIHTLIECAVANGAAAVAVPVKDTIKAAENNVFTETLDRSRLYAIQTPQGFQKDLLIRAYQKASEENFYGTDDAVLVENLGEKVYLVKGDYNNIKITTMEDMITGEAILASRKGSNPPEDGFRIGSGFDVHRLVEGRRLVLGGVEIPFEKGLLGHSDADVLVHAIMDALLGACGLGDIGRHFPDTDDRYKGISSLILLDEVRRLLDEHDYSIGNIDATVIAQRPKIAPYIKEMTRQLAFRLKIKEEQVNLKGTTTEKLGFCGREEGIAAQASVLIKRRNSI